MNQDALEFDKIKQQLAECAVTQYAKEKIAALTPLFQLDACRDRMRETTDAKTVVSAFGSPPLPAMTELGDIIAHVEREGMLLPEQLAAVMIFLVASRRMKDYLKRAAQSYSEIGTYGESIAVLPELYEELYRCVRNGAIEDNASPELKNLRRKIINASASIQAKLEQLLKSKKEYFSDGYVTVKAGRHVLPVKKEYRHQVSGSVVEISNSGSTCFIEPVAVQKTQDEISALRAEEDSEIRKILYTLTACVADYLPQIKQNRECLESLDFIFAKAKLSAAMDASPVQLTVERYMDIRQGRHPLLDRKICVPLDLSFGGETRGVVVTGPNTGGKTVALKTVGLLSLMAQCGLHIPANAESVICLHRNVLCDIGDGQSITENLSTFSAHISNIIAILEETTNESLVLLDELGSGTDPAEGMGLAVSVLEELNHRGCLFIATTHYPEIKEFAAKTSGLINAKMAFDKESLQPLYRLCIGEAGESCAFHIARRLGFPERMLKRAYEEAYSASKTDRTAPEMHFALNSDERTPPQRQSHTIQDSVRAKPAQPKRCDTFHVGDSVTVYPQKEIGIVYRVADERGVIGVQIKKKKQLINHKRIRLLTPAEQLYPDNYDFSILFDTVENRKKRHQMEKHHTPETEIIIGAEESWTR